MSEDKLTDKERINFQLVLEIMRDLHNIPEFEWLPELFTLVDYESLVNLCKFAGGEVIKIPTIEELLSAIDAVQTYYDRHIRQKLDNTSSDDIISSKLN